MLVFLVMGSFVLRTSSLMLAVHIYTGTLEDNPQKTQEQAGLVFQYELGTAEHRGARQFCVV